MIMDNFTSEEHKMQGVLKAFEEYFNHLNIPIRS